MTFVKGSDCKSIQGVIIYLPNQTQVKILSNKYSNFFDVRGNQASIPFRYLQLRDDEDKSTLLTNLYPEYSSDFVQYETTLEEYANNIYNVYCQRFIHKSGNFVQLPQQQYIIMSNLHNWHKEDRRHNKITIDEVREEIERQPALILNKLIKENIRSM